MARRSTTKIGETIYINIKRILFLKFSMEFKMHRCFHFFKILGAVVGFLKIHMVNNFVSSKVSAKFLFYYQTMLKNIALRIGERMLGAKDRDITISTPLSTFPIRVVFSHLSRLHPKAVASVGTKDNFAYFKIGRKAVDNLSANYARLIFAFKDFSAYWMKIVSTIAFYHGIHDTLYRKICQGGIICQTKMLL